MNHGFGDLPPVVMNLIIINVLVFVAVMLMPLGFNGEGLWDMPLFNALQLYYFETGRFHFPQFLTSMFHHAGILHLGMNMMALYFLGPSVELSLGRTRFLILYLLAGLGGGLLMQFLTYMGVHYPMLHTSGASVLGASGAIFGVFSAFALIAPFARLSIFPIPGFYKAESVFKFALTLHVVMISLEFFMGIRLLPISWDGHLGGLIAGFALMSIWKK
ncbi:rhomboid family intramembrane serine protease [Chitinophagales bacterium]|nr:rhomboid family intramembrane serine protease [Chitinophagales bacterium]